MTINGCNLDPDFLSKLADSWSPRLAPVRVVVTRDEVRFRYAVGCVVQTNEAPTNPVYVSQWVTVPDTSLYTSHSIDPVTVAVVKCLEELERQLLRNIMIGDNYSVFHPDIAKALAADIAERFGDIPITVTYGPELPFSVWTVRVMGGDNLNYSLPCVDPSMKATEYDVLRDAVLQLIFEWMEREEEDEP